MEGFYVLYSIIHVRLYNHVVSKDVKHKYILIYLGLIYASFYDNCETAFSEFISLSQCKKWDIPIP